MQVLPLRRATLVIVTGSASRRVRSLLKSWYSSTKLYNLPCWSYVIFVRLKQYSPPAFPSGPASPLSLIALIWPRELYPSINRSFMVLLFRSGPVELGPNSCILSFEYIRRPCKSYCISARLLVTVVLAGAAWSFVLISVLLTTWP